jgi:hypothetical protein
MVKFVESYPECIKAMRDYEPSFVKMVTDAGYTVDKLFNNFIEWKPHTDSNELVDYYEVSDEMLTCRTSPDLIKVLQMWWEKYPETHRLDYQWPPTIPYCLHIMEVPIRLSAYLITIEDYKFPEYIHIDYERAYFDLIDDHDKLVEEYAITIAVLKNKLRG